MTEFPVLQSYLARTGLVLSEGALQRFAAYRDLLFAANARVNLTRITDPVEFERRVLIESVALLSLIPSAASVMIDVGSGAGIPGIPLAIARPDMKVVLIDSTEKKIAFVRETAVSLGLSNVTAIAGRAEVLGRDSAHRDRYDVVTARAVARLATLAELALPFVASGGTAVFPKGQGASDELAEAQYAIRMLRGKPRPLVLDEDLGTSVIVIEKLADTPAQFPRRTGVPNKSPLLG